MQKAPCKDCADRKVGCHDTCSKYKAFVDEKRKNDDLIRASKRTYYHKRADYY